MTPNQTVALNMLRLRKVRGWRQRELAAKLGWKVTVVSTAERSASAKRIRHFSVDDLVLIAGAFGVAPSDLLAAVLPCATCQGSPPTGFTCQECGAAGDPPPPASRAAGSSSDPREEPVTSLLPTDRELREVPATDQAIRVGRPTVPSGEQRAVPAGEERPA